MAVFALLLIRLLRKLPRSSYRDKHLDKCVQTDIIYLASGRPSPLRASHVLRLRPLPDIEFGFVDMEPQSIHLSVVSDQVIGRGKDVASTDPRPVNKNFLQPIA